MSFIIFTLPRSRSAWMSHWLSYIKEGKRVKSVGHDAFSRCKSIEECENIFNDLDGTVETGAAFAYKMIVNRMPKTKLLVVQREPMDCLRSLMMVGLRPEPTDWSRRVEDLWAVSANGVRTVSYADLNMESCAKWIWEYCLELPWDAGWWAQWTPINVQINIQHRVEELLRNAGNVAKLKEEILGKEVTNVS